MQIKCYVLASETFICSYELSKSFILPSQGGDGGDLVTSERGQNCEHHAV